MVVLSIVNYQEILKRKSMTMAYSTCNTITLRNAILGVWTPAVGAKSFDELVNRNTDKIISSFGSSIISRIMIRDNLPLRPLFPQLEDFSDAQPPFQIEQEILSGSWSEGLYFYGHEKTKIPDMDYMIVLKNISFSKEDQLTGHLALKEETPFLYAYLTKESSIKMWNNYLVDDDKAPGKRLSSRRLKEKLQQNYHKTISDFVNDNSSDVDDGAAMYINRVPYNLPTIRKASKLFNNILPNLDLPQKALDFLQEVTTFTGWDIVLAISCDGWPSCAKEWLTRDRIWPHEHLVQKISRTGFHIIPKRSEEGDFRLSFSSAETTLIENFTELQHKVIRSFKAVVKFHQDTWGQNIKEIITTYHLKTIAFWHFEKIEKNSFTEEMVATHLVLLLQELAKALRVRKLPMYFMPKVNLFSNVENSEEAVNIAEKIDYLSQDNNSLIESLENITSGFQQVHSIGRNIYEKTNDLCGKIGSKEKGTEICNAPIEKLSMHFRRMRELQQIFNPITSTTFNIYDDGME